MIELNVKGMTCGHCADAVTRAVKSVDPEARVQVDLGSRRVRIEGQSTVDQLTRALAAAGYPAAPAEPQTLAASTKGGCCCH